MTKGFLVLLVLPYNSVHALDIKKELYEIACFSDAQEEFDKFAVTQEFADALKELEQTPAALQALSDYIGALHSLGFRRMRDAFSDLISVFSDNTDVYSPDDFEWTTQFRLNYKEIVQEFWDFNEKSFDKQGVCEDSEEDSFDRSAVTDLRIFNQDHCNINQFPITAKLINSVPCSTAFFSIVKPHTKLWHRSGYSKGLLSYNLGLQVPENNENCFININGKKLHWVEGSDLMYDDTYEHWIENNTDETRVILYLQVTRDNISNSIIKWLSEASIPPLVYFDNWAY